MKEIKIETQGIEVTPQQAPRAEFLEGALRVVTSEPSWKPRTREDYECIWDDTSGSGNIYKCFYVSTQSAWYRSAALTSL